MTIATTTLALDGGRPVRSTLLPLHRPWFDDREALAVERVLESGKTCGDGRVGHELESLIAQKVNARFVLLVNSCTAALEVAVKVAGLGAGDEVILPSFTFVSTANAVVGNGATPVFADIDPVTGNLDPAAIERAIGPRTKAIIVVHYAGMACPMDRIMAIANRHGLLVIEDAAHAVNAAYRGRELSTWGAMGCVSFHETKDLVCGEGGALVVRDERQYASAAEIIREKGTDRSAFLRGERDKYTWVAHGSSLVLSDILAAVALEQFRKLDVITQRKTAVATRLLEALRPYNEHLRLPVVPEGCRPNWHLFAVQVDPIWRDWMIRALRAEGIGAAFHYVPLHSAPYACETGLRRTELPHTDHVAASIVRLPIFAAMTERDCRDVVDAIDKALCALAKLEAPDKR